MLQPKVTRVEPVKPYVIRLTYETGEIKLFDVEPYISGTWFGKLKDWSYFKTVRVLPDGVGIEWADGQDIAPHELYECSSDWDADFTKVTPDEHNRIREAENSGFVDADEIDWDDIGTDE